MQKYKGSDKLLGMRKLAFIYISISAVFILAIYYAYSYDLPKWFPFNIEYISDENLAEGTIITSPYFGNIKLIVAESGRKNLNKWVFEERNIYEDYKKCFRGTPPLVGAIALMTDTDNTLSTAEASYKNIRVGYKNEDKK